MPYRLINIDLVMVTLNMTSVATMTLAWFSDHLNSVGGFIVMMSVAYLNYIKAQKIKKSE